MALTLSKDGALYLNGERSNDAVVIQFINGELPKNPDLQAIIAADGGVAHRDVIHVIDLVKRTGVHRFAHQRRPQRSSQRSWQIDVAIAGEGIPELREVWPLAAPRTRFSVTAAVVALGLHAALAVAVTTIDPARFHAETPIEIDVEEHVPATAGSEARRPRAASAAPRGAASAGGDAPRAGARARRPRPSRGRPAKRRPRPTSRRRPSA